MTYGVNGPQLYDIKDDKVISPQGEPFSIKFALEYIYGYRVPDVAEQGNRAERRKRNR